METGNNTAVNLPVSKRILKQVLPSLLIDNDQDIEECLGHLEGYSAHCQEISAVKKFSDSN